MHGIRPFFWTGGNVMSAQREFYRERAAEARDVAGSATLDNVRDRWLRAEATWTEMAERSERGDRMRAKLIAQKAAERAALKKPQSDPDELRVQPMPANSSETTRS
jgi:hypothetical protein